MKKILTIARPNLKNGNYRECTTQVIGKDPKEREVECIADVLRLLVKKATSRKEVANNHDHKRNF